MRRNALELGLGGLILLSLPLAGVWWAGKPLSLYGQFPPITRYVEHAPFSVPVFALLALLIVLVVLPFILRVAQHRGRRGAVESLAGGHFPWWGWSGLVAGAGAWVLAWTRFSWFAPIQPFTFTPLWLAYILVVNAWTLRRLGRCLLVHRTRFYLLLFPLSAVFWWFFEYLNRFAQNWYYVGIDNLNAVEYFVFATLPFSTVLPAVLATEELLRSFPSWFRGLDRWARWRVPAPRVGAALVLLAAAGGLAGIGIWPDYLFPLLWLSPLLILTSWQTIRGDPTIFDGIAAGDWRRIGRLELAALLCGVFWEMWNYHSMAKWVYSVPYVNRFHVFEMPILGYAGYLPFGLECGVVALWLERSILNQKDS